MVCPWSNSSFRRPLWAAPLLTEECPNSLLCSIRPSSEFLNFILLKKRSPVLGKAMSCTQSFEPYLATEERAFGLKHFLTKRREPTQPALGLLLRVGISLPVSDSLCAPWFCLRMCVDGPQACPSFLYFKPHRRKREFPLLQCVVG